MHGSRRNHKKASFVLRDPREFAFIRASPFRSRRARECLSTYLQLVVLYLHDDVLKKRCLFYLVHTVLFTEIGHYLLLVALVQIHAHLLDFGFNVFFWTPALCPFPRANLGSSWELATSNHPPRRIQVDPWCWPISLTVVSSFLAVHLIFSEAPLRFLR